MQASTIHYLPSHLVLTVLQAIIALILACRLSQTVPKASIVKQEPQQALIVLPELTTMNSTEHLQPLAKHASLDGIVLLKV